MPHVEITEGSYYLVDGTCLFEDLTLRIGAGVKAVLIGANGLGKTTLMRILAGEVSLADGSRAVSGTVGVMPQFVGTGFGPTTVRELLLATAPARVRRAGTELVETERALVEEPEEERLQMRFAQALSDWADVGGYQVEAEWDDVMSRTVGVTFAANVDRDLTAFSGGEQKKIVLDALFGGPSDLLLLDEPDNYLDVVGKRWLEERIVSTSKAVLFVSHDRELVANTATGIYTLEPGLGGASVWYHSGGYSSYAEARARRNERLDEVGLRWDEKELQLKKLVEMYRQKSAYNSDMASRYQSACTRLAKFRAEGRPEAAPQLKPVTMRLTGGRTAKRALTIGQLAVPGIFAGFDTEVWFGDRVAVTGPNGTGKSHFLAAIDDADQLDRYPDTATTASEWTGRITLGSRVTVGHFAQTHERPDLAGRTLVEVLHRGTDDREGMSRDGAITVLGRYGLASRADVRFDQLSGGQQARFQIALLEAAGKRLLLLDEPTDNLDLISVEALEVALDAFEGTVIAVTHDRWFARRFDRFLYFAQDGQVAETDQARWG